MKVKLNDIFEFVEVHFLEIISERENSYLIRFGKNWCSYIPKKASCTVKGRGVILLPKWMVIGKGLLPFMNHNPPKPEKVLNRNKPIKERNLRRIDR